MFNCAQTELARTHESLQFPYVYHAKDNTELYTPHLQPPLKWLQWQIKGRTVTHTMQQIIGMFKKMHKKGYYKWEFA